MSKTRAELDQLIVSWRDDPSWEIELTDGFEEHKDELLAVRLKCETEWRAQAGREHAAAIAGLMKPAVAMFASESARPVCQPGTDGHQLLRAFAEMLFPLKQQLDRLDARVDANYSDLQDQIDKLARGQSRGLP